MKAALLLAALATACSAQPAPARSLGDRIREMPDEEWVYQGLHVADFALTYSCLARETCRELNPLLGSNPGKGKLIGFAVGTGILHAAAASLIQDRDPAAARTFARVSVMLKGGVLGIHFAREF